MTVEVGSSCLPGSPLIKGSPSKLWLQPYGQSGPAPAFFWMSLEVCRRTGGPSHSGNPWQRSLRQKHSKGKAPVYLSCHANPGLWIHRVKFTAFLQHFPRDRRHNEAFIPPRESETGDVTLSWRFASCRYLSLSQCLTLLVAAGRKEEKKDECTSCVTESVCVCWLWKVGGRDGRLCFENSNQPIDVRLGGHQETGGESVWKINSAA